MMPDAIALYLLLDDIAAHVVATRPRIADQLFRAALSFVLNLEEGSFEFAHKEKTRFYRIAYRSVAECRVLLDILAALGLLPPSTIAEAQRRLERLSPQAYNLITRKTKTNAIAEAPR